MNVSREEIYGALFARLSAIPGLVTASRRLQPPDRIRTEALPALFLIEREEQPTWVTGRPAASWKLRAEVYLYVATGGDHTAEVPAVAINRLLDAIDAALAPDPVSGYQTLGLPIVYARIQGKVQIDEAPLNSRAVVRLPIEILTN